MNKLLLSMAILILMGITLMGQTRISGVVKDATTEKEIYDLTVLLVETGEEVKTDRIGYFQFVDVQPGLYNIKISGTGYVPLEKEITVGTESTIDLGDLKITFNPANETVGIVTLTVDELDDDESSSQSSAGLLQSSRDVFARNVAFELGAFWFKVRGYDNKYNDVFFNGIRMNKISNDRVNFGNWGGLNDVTRYPSELTVGIEPSNIAFGDVGGITNFDTRPSMMRKGVSLSYSFTNRSYNQRAMATYNTGLMENGWAFMGSFARRWAEEGVIDGTFYDSWAYYFAAEKKINDKHSLIFTGFGAPTKRSTNSPNTQEVYDLMGKDYNAYWGWQDGEKRSERIRNFHEPIAMLTHYWNINEKTRLTSTVAYQFGKDSRSRLDWYRANNPSPIYYRYLPSYYIFNNASQETINQVINAWHNDQSYSQIDWADIYNQNYNRNGGGAAYVLAGDVNEDRTFSFNSNLKTHFASNIDFIAAVSYQNTTSESYREVIDLLGGSYYVNLNGFDNFSYDMNGDTINEEGDIVYRKVYEGDKYQYHYEINRQYADFFAQAKMALNDFDITLGFKAAYTKYQRDGKYLNELYQNNSYGKSKAYDFLDFGIKTQIQYKIDGRNFLQLNGLYSTYAPTADELFPNARSNDFSIDGIESSKILSGDLNYILRASRIKGRATVFYTKFMDEYDRAFGYIDRSEDGTSGSANGDNGDVFSSEILAGVDKQFFGSELALEAQVTTTITVSAVASIGQYTYSNNPRYLLYSDDYAENYGGKRDFGITYLKDYYVATGPQQGYSLGVEYRDPNYWWIGITGNYLAQNYIDIAPFKRTQMFFTHPVSGNPYEGVTEESLRSLLQQESFSNEFMVNANVGKTFRFGKYFMGISLNVNNVFNNRDYVTGGFEQMRIGNYPDAQNPEIQNMFGPRMWYDRGRSYFLNVFFRF